MTIQEAIQRRHSIRQYTNQPIEIGKLEELQVAIDAANKEGDLNIQLVTNEITAFNSGLAKYGKFKNVSNYLVLVGPKGKLGDERIGYYGELLVLKLQAMGLNSCWVGLTYKKDKVKYHHQKGQELKCVISFGYGASQGTWHPLKRMEDVAVNCSSTPFPDWFIKGIKAALLAPTAVNQHKYEFILHENNIVEAKTKFSIWGYTHIDLGIVKLHFEVGAGKENFEWLHTS